MEKVSLVVATYNKRITLKEVMPSVLRFDFYKKFDKIIRYIKNSSKCKNDIIFLFVYIN